MPASSRSTVAPIANAPMPAPKNAAMALPFVVLGAAAESIGTVRGAIMNPPFIVYCSGATLFTNTPINDTNATSAREIASEAMAMFRNDVSWSTLDR